MDDTETDQQKNHQTHQNHQNHHDCCDHHSHWIWRLFWGLLLIIIGALALANNFGWVNVHWSNILSLWPLIIIAAGLSMLSIDNIIWKIIATILMLLTLAACTLAALGYSPNSYIRFNYDNSSVSLDSNKIKSDFNQATNNLRDRLR
jgi:cation transport ATPase